MIFEIAVVLVLILVNGFFAMSELAVLSSRPARLRQKAEEGNKRASRVLALIEDPSRFLSTVQVGITLVGIFAGAYSGATLGAHLGEWLSQFPILADYADSLAIGFVVLIITYLSLVVGELVPKRLALTNPEAIALIVVPFLQGLAVIGKPLVGALGVSTDLLLRIFGIRGQKTETVTEEEVTALIAEGTRSGVFEPVEKAMIDRVLLLADRPARAIMTPRRDVIWLDVKAEIQDIRAIISKHGHSRYVVSDGQIDEILGIVTTMDILDRVMAGGRLDLASSLRPPLVVPENTKILRLLDTFRQTGHHLALIVDEYGSLEGIVSITDILESITGDLPHTGATAETIAVQRDDGSWLIDGMENIDEVERRTGLKGLREDGDFHTLAGFILNRLKHVPEIGESFIWNETRFEVVDMDGRRIDRVLIEPQSSTSQAEDDDEQG